MAPRERDAASAAYVVAFQIGVGSGALVGERTTAAGHLGALPLLAAGLAVVALVLVVVSRPVFPVRLDDADHAPAEVGLAGVPAG